MTSRRYRRLTPDERDREADDRDEMACSRDRVAQARAQDSAARDVAARFRDEAAMRRDLTMRDWIRVPSQREDAAGNSEPSTIADGAAVSADDDAGQLAWWRGEAVAARRELADQRRVLAEERDKVRILLYQIWLDRRAAAEDRDAAAHDRDAASREREAAVRDREAASAARQQAAVEQAEEHGPSPEVSRSGTRARSASAGTRKTT